MGLLLFCNWHCCSCCYYTFPGYALATLWCMANVSFFCLRVFALAVREGGKPVCVEQTAHTFSNLCTVVIVWPVLPSLRPLPLCCRCAGSMHELPIGGGHGQAQPRPNHAASRQHAHQHAPFRTLLASITWVWDNSTRAHVRMHGTCAVWDGLCLADKLFKPSPSYQVF